MFFYDDENQLPVIRTIYTGSTLLFYFILKINLESSYCRSNGLVGSHFWTSQRKLSSCPKICETIVTF